MRSTALLSCSRPWRSVDFRLDLHAGAHGRVGDAVDNDAVVGAEAAFRTTRSPSCIGPSTTGLQYDLVVGIERKNDLARLVRYDRAIGDQNGIDVAGKELNAAETRPA